jgi:hypothetical protein
MPFATLQNIQLTLQPHTYIPYFVTQKEYCSVYHTSFSIDVAKELLENEIIDLNILASCEVFLNENVFKNIKINSDEATINTFLSEVNSQQLETNFTYSNTITLNNIDNCVSNICNNVYLNSKNESYYLDGEIYIEDIMSDKCKDPVTQLIKLITEQDLVLLKLKLSYSYYFQNNQSNYKFDYENIYQHSIHDEYNIYFSEKTLFDSNTNLLTLNSNGITGLFIPDICNGILDIQLTMSDTNNNMRYINFKKDLSFSDDTKYDKMISKKSKDFEVTNDFMEEKFYD